MGYTSKFQISFLVYPTGTGGDAYGDIKIRAQASQRIMAGEDIAEVTEWARTSLMTLRQPVDALAEKVKRETHAMDVATWNGSTIVIGSCTWYEMREEMARVSVSFPGSVIQVDRSGVDDGDIERTWFADGKATPGVKPVMTWPEFDRAMLGAEES